MDFGRIVKWLLIIAVVVVAWKAGKPLLDRSTSSPSSSSSSSASGDSSCISAAGRASDAWGGGIGRFVNPPYDLNAWSEFRGGVEDKIATAEAACSCDDESCRKVQSAMRDLRSLVADLDGAIRAGGAPPDGIVQRQEAIDNQLDAARDLVRQGK